MQQNDSKCTILSVYERDKNNLLIESKFATINLSYDFNAFVVVTSCSWTTVRSWSEIEQYISRDQREIYQFSLLNCL